MAKRERRRENPVKNEKKKHSKDDCEPPAGGAPGAAPLESFLRRVKNELGLEEAGLTVRLVSDAEISRMNETFRKKKGPTDVLSFPMWRGEDRSGCGAARGR